MDDYHVLTGCALPPKVVGVPRGAVLLSVPHVLPSAAAHGARRLPRAALVRVRWWGEDRPGSSLFRPTRIDHEGGESKRETDGESDGDDDAGDSALRMRYPVCVPLPQLLEYLRDMRELVFDVVDRHSRKKVGRSALAFALPASDRDERGAADSLRRTNALCEIYSTAESKELLGYLTVNFEVEWTESPAVATPLKWTNSSTPAVTVNPAMAHHAIGPASIELERNIQQRLSFSSISSSSTASEIPRSRPWRGGEAVAVDSTADTTVAAVVGSRLEVVLEKGRALQNSMAAAITDEATVGELAADNAAAGPVSPTSMKVLLAPFEAMTDEVDNTWERVLEEAEGIKSATPAVQATLPAKTALQESTVSLGEFNALELSFESMELEEEMIDRLRQLREGSVSTRFSPIQLVVSHEHPRVLLHDSSQRETDRWIAAFAVNSSLRKRQWRTTYTHTLPLEVGKGVGRLQLRQHAIRFRVRCKPQHASPPGRRRREPRQTLDLTSELLAEDLLENRDREWVVTLPLRLETTSSEATKAAKSSKARYPVGRITLRLRFKIVRDQTSQDPDREASSISQSSAWSVAEHDHDAHEHDSRPFDLVNPSVAHRTTHSVARDRELLVDIPLFLGLLIGRALVRNPSDAVTSESRSVGNGARFTLRLDYGTPSFFGRSSTALHLRRSAKASLRGLEQDQLSATFGHMNVFPIDVSTNFVNKLERGLLILEVWMQEHSATLATYATEKLLGVVKIPLHVFRDCMRSVETIAAYLSHDVPFVGVDEDFPIVDPLNDQVNGQVHVRMAFGSTEQIFNLKSTLTAVVKLQSHVRGWIARRAVSYWKRFELNEVNSEQNEELPSRSVAARENFSSQSTSPHSVNANNISVSEDLHQTSFSVEAVITRLEVRVEVLQHYPKGDSGAIGCEVHGHLRFQDTLSSSAVLSSSGPRFTLWWDSQDDQLNSYFYHSVQASDLDRGIDLHEVVLLFRVEPQFPTSRRAGDRKIKVKGVATLELHSVFTQYRANQGVGWSSDMTNLVEDLNVPIVWNYEGLDFQEPTIPRTLPLRVDLKLVRENKRGPTPKLIGATNENMPKVEGLDRDNEVTAVRSLSRTERLLPASLRLCLDIQRIAGLQDLLQTHLANTRQEQDQSGAIQTLSPVIDGDSVTIGICVSICIGSELHPEELEHDDEFELFQDEESRWHKRFRFDDISLEIANRVQALPSITQGDALVIVHRDLIEYLQENNLDVLLYVSGELSRSRIGAVSIPMSAVLFRPTGIQGSFPVQTGDVLVGRLGVHLYIEHEKERIIPEPQTREADEESYDSQSTLPRVAGAYPLEVRKVNDDASSAPSSTPARVSSPTDETSAEIPSHHMLDEAVANFNATSRDIQERLSRLAQMTNSSQVSTNPELNSTPVGSFVESEAYFAEQTTEQTLASSIPDSTHSSQQSSCGGDDGVVEPNNLHSDDAKPGRISPDEETKLGEEAFRPITLGLLGIEEIEFSPTASPQFCEKESSSLQSEEENTEAVEDECIHSEDMTNRTSEEGEARAQQLLVSSAVISTVVTHEEKSDPALEGESDLLVTHVCIPQSPSNNCEAIEPFDIGEPEVLIRHSHLLAGIHGMAPTQPSNALEVSEGEFMLVHDESSYPPRTTLDVESKNGSVVDADEVLDGFCGDHEECGETADDIEHKHVRPVVVEVVSDTNEVTHGGLEGQDAAGRRPSGRALVNAASDIEDRCDIQDADTNFGDHDQLDGNTLSVTDDASTTTSVSTNEHRSYDGFVDRFKQEQSSQTPEEDFQSVALDNPHEQLAEEPSLQVLIQESPSDDHNRLQKELRCDAFTQTEDQFYVSSVEAAVQIDVAIQEDRDNVSLEKIDFACQTMTEYIDESSLDDQEESTETLAATTTDDSDQLVHNKNDEGVSLESPPQLTTNPNGREATGQSKSLPVEKINIAWQLLGEIRELYVANDNLQDSSSSASLEGSNMVTADGPSLDSPTIEAPTLFHARELVSDHDTFDAKTNVEGHDDKADAIHPLKTQIAVRQLEAWQWDDESTLMAKVDGRLGHSKQGYEDALSLSQSGAHFESSHASPSVNLLGTSLTIEQEEKALELSASARAKSSRSRAIRLDTETERIARIMQGNLKNLLGEDNEDESSDSDEESDDCYF